MLRVAGGVPVVYRSGPTGGATTNWGSGVGRAEDFDFDQNNFMWVVGANETNSATNQSIVRVQDNGATRSYVRKTFVANGHSVKVYNGFVYVGGTRGGNPFIWRFPILPDNTLGDEEMVVDLGVKYATDIIPRSIAFATDGTMFVSLSGTNFDQLPAGRQPLLAVAPNGDVIEYYPGIVPGIIVKMHWVPGTQRVLMTLLPREVGQTQRLITINFQKNGAPFYGIE
jgi:glucose/arabinose dehydrogenase